MKLLDAQSTCSTFWSPTVTIQDKIPEEAWSGTKTSVAHLRIFGSVSFTHIRDELKRKLDKKSECCIFTGYTEQHRTYKSYNPATKKVVVRRDVKFIEDKCQSDPSHIHQEESSDMPYLPIRLPRLEVQQQEETLEDIPYQNQKTKFLRELYEQTPVINEQLQYALFSYHPTYFDEAVKDAQWVQAMNEEIDAIEKNQTWDLVDIPANNTSIRVNGSIIPK